MIALNSPYARHTAALIVAIMANIVIIFGLPVSLRFSAPIKKDRSAEAIRLSDYRKPPPPPPKKEEIKKEVQPKQQVQPKLKNFMPKMDVDGIGGGFKFDLSLSRGPDMGGLAVSIGSKIWDESKVDAKPVAVFRTKPVFPSKAASDNITGKVAFKFLVDRDGMVKDMEILSAEPKGMFEDATRNAVMQWRFQPAKVKGTPVACWCQTAITFELE
jgi:protein TonB